MNLNKTKRIFLLVICFFAISVMRGQTSMTLSSYEPHYLGRTEVVKEYKHPVTITSSNNDDGFGTLFSYNDSSHRAYRSLFNECNVTDFAIGGDTVFFCGNGMNGRAIIGFFDIDELFFGNGLYYYWDQYSVATQFYAEVFNKMVTYIDTNRSRHIVCVGVAKNVLGEKYPCIVDLFSENAGQYIAYNAGMIKDSLLVGSTMDIERLCSAVYGENRDSQYPECDYLIVGGVDSKQHLTLRFFNAQNPLSMTGPQNTLYTFDDYGSPGYDNRISKILLSTKSDHLVSVASVMRFPLMPMGQANFLKIHDINIFNLLGGMATAMTNSALLVVDNYNRVNKLDEFVYNYTTSRYALLFEGENDGEYGEEKSYFIETDNSLTTVLNSMSGADDGECGEKRFDAMDMFNSNMQYVMIGHCRDYVWQYNYGVETSGMQSGCLPQVEATLMESELAKSSRMSSIVEPYGGRNAFKTQGKGVGIYGIDMDCSH